MAESQGFFDGVQDKLLMMQQIAGKATAATKSDLETVSKKSKALKKLVDEDDEILALYKIEMHFEKRRTDRGAFPGILLVFKTGVLSGGGDEILYPCPDDACSGYIDFDHRSSATGQALCTACGNVWEESALTGIRGYKLSVDGWAEVVSKVFWDLGGRADIYLKTHWSDLRKAAIKETIMERRGEDLYEARKKVVLRYALGAILKDTATGSSLESRIRGLLRA